MTEICLTNSEKVAIIDNDDNDLVSCKWFLHNPSGIYSTKEKLKLIRVIAERKLNRPLESYERCRYKNNDKLDNRRNNIEIIPPMPITKGKLLIIGLSRDKISLIDKDDIDLSRVKWTFTTDGYACRNTGSRSKKNKRMIYLHRIILERKLNRPLTNEENTDHKNGNRLDNRRSNLRIATYSQNAKHQIAKIPNTSSIYKGVFWHKKNRKWIAQINSDGVHYSLGSYKNEMEAAIAYDEGAKKYHGEFAALNFPD